MAGRGRVVEFRRTLPGEYRSYDCQELWLAVAGKFCGWPYDVSSHGRVRSRRRWRSYLHGKVITPSRDSCGRLQVTLYQGDKSVRAFVHHIVAEAFVAVRPPGLEINHKNGDTDDNRPANLEWVTHTENINHAVRTGLFPRGSRCGNSKLTEHKVRCIRQMRHLGARCLGVKFGVTTQNIEAILANKTWKHVDV